MFMMRSKNFVFLKTVFLSLVLVCVFPKSVQAETSIYTPEFTAEASGDYLSSSFASGDINGDGYSDILIGAPYHNGFAGIVYLIYGGSSLLSSTTLSSAGVVKFSGEADSGAGVSIATGNFNGDEYDDILIGATGYNNDTGRVYLIYGQSDDLVSDNLANKIYFTGINENDITGVMVASGNIDGDPYDDILISESSMGSGYVGNGSVFLIYGHALDFVSIPLNDSSVYRFTGESPASNTGISLATGDVDGDTYDDIVIGASEINKVYLLYGQPSDLSSHDLSADIQFSSGELESSFGFSLATGNINNDNYADIIIGCPNDGALEKGAVYLLYGQAIDLSSHDVGTSEDIKFYGLHNSEAIGLSVSVGDINADNYDDILIGKGAFENGYIFFIFGQSTPLTTTAVGIIDFDGLSFIDVASTFNKISTAGDVNGDGFSDVLVGNPGVNANTGIAYLAYIYVDVDHDGSLGGQYAVDCNDNDASISTNQTYYADLDGDALGNSNNTTAVCSYSVPGGYVANASDQNDNDYDNDGSETGTDCNDANVNISSNQTYYQDSDGDGLGNISVTQALCSLTAPAGYVANTSDQNDSDYDNDSINDNVDNCATISNANQLNTDSDSQGNSCDADDDNDNVNDVNDCASLDANISSNQTYYQDSDGDGLGNTSVTQALCSLTVPTGYVTDHSDTNDNDYDNDGSETGTDCNDADAAISSNQTYYADTDSDTLGDANNITTACSLTAPEGYVDNSNDTNDAIVNNGVEIAGDGVDNDFDGEVDEVNTIANNGLHPQYGGYDPADQDVYNAAVLSVASLENGQILVTYGDNSQYQYTVFEVSTTKTMKTLNYNSSGYLIALHPNGKKISLINIYSGEIYSTKTLSKDKKYKNNSLKIKTVRDQKVAIVTSKATDNKVRLSLVKIKIAENSFKKKSSVTLTNKKVKVDKTKIKTKEIILRDKNSKNLKTYKVTEKFELKEK